MHLARLMLLLPRINPPKEQMKIINLKSATILVLMLAPCIGTAASISLTPTSGVLGTTRWENTTFGHSNGDFLNFVASVTSNPELYKQNAGGGEEKILAGSYATTLTGGNSAGTITYGSGNTVGSTAYLGLKDGNNSPFSYLFNLTALGWTGTEKISFSGFWPTNGAISHVSLFGDSRPPGTGGGGRVPDGGTTLVTLGIALLGLGSMRKFLFSKA